jgi:hypothetical protein
MTEQEFIYSKGNYFHLRLMKYAVSAAEMSTGGELELIKENNYALVFDFPEGQYSIKWDDLVIKSNDDLEEFKKDYPAIEFDNSSDDTDLHIID